MLNEHDIEVDIHGVTVAGQRILRPKGTAISEWMGFWDAVKALAATGRFGATDEVLAPARHPHARGYYRGGIVG